MKAAPIGLADVIEAAETLQLRGAALEATAAMLGFAVPTGQAPVAPPASEPPPARKGGGRDAIGAVTPTAEVLSPSVRRLEPVRQGTSDTSAWTDPLAGSREERRRAAARERIADATCRLERFEQSATGVLVSGSRIVASHGAVAGFGLQAPFAVQFRRRPESTAVLTRLEPSVDVAVLDWRNPDPDALPVSFGMASPGPYEGYGYVRVVSGTILDVDGRDPSGRPALVLESNEPDGGRLAGMPIVQHGRVVGHLKAMGSDWPRGRSIAYASRAADVVASVLPGEVLHEPLTVPPGPPAFESLLAARDALALLRLAASMPTPGDRLDVPRITAGLARARPLSALPRLRVPSLALGARILVDVGEPMQPFWDDQQELAGRVRHLLRDSADVRYVGDLPEDGIGQDRR